MCRIFYLEIFLQGRSPQHPEHKVKIDASICQYGLFLALNANHRIVKLNVLNQVVACLLHLVFVAQDSSNTDIREHQVPSSATAAVLQFLFS